MIVSLTSEVLSQYLVHPLSLSICLGVESSECGGLDIQKAQDFEPEAHGELGGGLGLRQCGLGAHEDE